MPTTNRLLKSCSPVIAALSGLLAWSAAAETESESSNTIEEVIVRATKKNTSAINYDGLVSTVSQQQLNQQNVVSVDDLGKSIAGLLFRQRGNSAYDNITLRGQSSVDFYSPKVQVYIDGFVQDQATYGLLLPSSIEQVEVLYGPQGSLYGRGAVGGVIDVVTVHPSELPTVSASTRQGELTEEYRLSLATGLGKGWSGDIAGIDRSLDGEYHDSLSQETLGYRDDQRIQARLAYGAEDSPWSLLLKINSSETTSTEEQYVLAAQVDDRQSYPLGNHYKLKSDQFQAKASYTFGDIVFSSLTSHQDRELNRTVFGSYTPEFQTTTTQEFQLSSYEEEGQSIFYVAGIYYEFVDFEYGQPAYSLKPLQEIETLALYGDLSWNVTPKLTLTLGLRAEQSETDAESIFASTSATGNKDFSHLSPKIALGYQLDPDTRLYGLYSSGYKPGGFGRISTPAIAQLSYGEETVDNYELGWKKGFFSGRGVFSMAAYLSKHKNFQMFVGTQPNQYLQNVGAAESKGVDANLQLLLTEQLKLALGYAWNQAEFVEYNNPLNPDLNLAGNKLPHAPEQSWNVSLSHELSAPNNLGQLITSFHVNYVDEMYFDEYNYVGEDAVTLYSANLQWRVSKRLKIDFYGNNLSNELYRVYGFDGGATLGGVFYQLGQGREFGLRISVEL